MIQFSVITKDSGILTKRYSLVDGELTKDSSQCFLDRGKVETINIDFKNLPGVIDKLDHTQAIVHGVAIEALIRPVPIVSRQLLPANPGAITRTLDKFFWPEDGIMMFDYDPPPGATPLTKKELIEALRSLDPQLATAAMVWRPSASSNIVGDDNTVYAGLRNQRIYVQYKNPGNMEEFVKNLFMSAWEKEMGYIFITAAGIPLERTIFDMAVFSPERLDFAAGGVCGKGLKKQVIFSQFISGKVVDLDLIAEPQDIYRHEMNVSVAKRAVEGQIAEKRAEYITEQATRIAQRQGITKAKARVVVESRMDNKLLPDDVVYTDDMEPITVREILLSPENYNGMVVRDPLEPEYGKSKAKIFVDDDGVCIHSFAHGKQIYRVKFDIDYVLAKLMDTATEDLEAVWQGHYNNLEATPTGRDKLAKYISKEVGVSKTAVVKEMAELDKKNQERKKAAALTHNEMAMGVIAALGDNVIATEGSIYSFDKNRWVKRQPNVAMDKVITLYDGCEQCRTVAQYKAITGHVIDLLDKPLFFSELTPVVATKDGYWQLDAANAVIKKVPVDRALRVRFVFPFESSAQPQMPKLFMTFLEWAFERDLNQIQLMQEAMGAVFLGVLTRQWQKAILFRGIGQNGKGTMLDIISGIMPKEFISAVSPEKFYDDNHKIMLAGKLLNICPELEKGKPLPSAAFKTIIDAGTITARAVYERAVSFDSTAAHLFSTNHRLILNDDSKGMKRRWLFFSFDNTIPDEQKVPGLAQTIVRQEAADIFHWAMEGACRLYRNNVFTATASNTRVAEQTFIGQNPLADFLVDTDVIELLDAASPGLTPEAAKKYFTLSKPLYKAYRSWFAENAPSKKLGDAMDYNVFCCAMEEKYGAQTRQDNKRGWKGIKLLNGGAGI